jgi:hypothetical protein
VKAANLAGELQQFLKFTRNNGGSRTARPGWEFMRGNLAAPNLIRNLDLGLL